MKWSLLLDARLGLGLPRTSKMMKSNRLLVMGCLLVVMPLGVMDVTAAAKKAVSEPVSATPLTAEGDKLLAKYAELLKSLQAEIAKALPNVSEQNRIALEKAREATKAALAEANAKQAALDANQKPMGLLEHRKGWVSKAAKAVAAAEEKIKLAKDETVRQAAQDELAKAKADGDQGAIELKKSQDAVAKAKIDEPTVIQENQAAQAALARARNDEQAAAAVILTAMEPFLSSDQLDARLVTCAVLAEAVPQGLAAFGQQGKEQEALVEKLLAEPALMKEMLEAGGAKFGKYGRAMEIYMAIQHASQKACEGAFQRLALATSLEHAVPIAQSNPQDQVNAPAVIDPVKRYLHYEKACLDGELDSVFKNLSVWEYRKVVDCDAPDSILAWGREMLRNYRPDHIYNPDYGWRYSMSVRTDVQYGSQNQKYDLPSLQSYQNIIKDGGVCGRRAFFGRFMLRSFGIPTWGVTQHAHAALSHWTPKGWVVNLGAGFQHSWWEKDETPRIGSDFLLETQARAKPQEYRKVLRAQWISRALGEQAYNDRQHVAGGFWSGMAHYQTVAIAASAVGLGPLGQELGESNEAKQTDKVEQAKLAEVDRKVVLGPDGAMIIPAAAHTKANGPVVAMKCFGGGMQLHCGGGFTAEYTVDVAHAGKYALMASVVTVQEGQKFQFASNDAKEPVEVAVPYTVGKWQQTQPVELSLANGKNLIHFTLKDGSRGVSVKEFTLRPVR